MSRKESNPPPSEARITSQKGVSRINEGRGIPPAPANQVKPTPPPAPPPKR